MDATNSRFVKTTEDERNKMIEGVIPEGTKRNTRYAVSLFKKWLTENYGNDDFEQLTEENLNTLLTQFYAEVRSEKGEYLSKSTLVTIRSGIQRHLDSPPFNRNFGICSNPAFAYSNKMFATVVKRCKQEGNDKTKHHAVIPDCDMKKVLAEDAFDLQSPRGLQMKVFFDIQYYFARRGRENLRNLKKSHFTTATDDSGKQYIEMAINESTKNHPTSDDNIQRHRMYETQKTNCPVKSFLLYVERLDPEIPHFYCQAKYGKKFDPTTENIWYSKNPLGINTLGTLMQQISKKLKLSQCFTNHSIRATVITILSRSGFESREIMRVTGHKSEASLRSYDRDNSASCKRQISATLNFEHVETKKQKSSNPSSKYFNRPTVQVSTAPASNLDFDSTLSHAEDQELTKKQKALKNSSTHISSSTVQVPAPASTSNFDFDSSSSTEDLLSQAASQAESEAETSSGTGLEHHTTNTNNVQEMQTFKHFVDQSISGVKEQFKVNNMTNCTFNFTFNMKK